MTHRQTRPTVNTADTDGCDPTRHHEPSLADYHAAASGLDAIRLFLGRLHRKPLQCDECERPAMTVVYCHADTDRHLACEACLFEMWGIRAPTPATEAPKAARGEQ